MRVKITDKAPYKKCSFDKLPVGTFFVWCSEMGANSPKEAQINYCTGLKTSLTHWFSFPDENMFTNSPTENVRSVFVLELSDAIPLKPVLE